MKIADPSAFVGELTTVGRRTGLPRTVEVNMVWLRGKFYTASSRVDRKHWCRNMIANPRVVVTAAGKKFSCAARRVEDEALRREVLNLRDGTAQVDRVVFELAPQT